MGLDLVDFVLEIEEAFELRFPDEDAATITTPRRLIDSLMERLPAGEPICLSQRACYRLRHAVAARLQCAARSVGLDTPLLALVPAAQRTAFWEEVRHDLGAPKARAWPRLAEAGWFDLFRRTRIGTLREAAQQLALRMPCRVMNPGDGWTRSQVANIVHALICDRFGIRRSDYTEDSRWREDMGVD
jgi:acyl carrier protein